MKRYDKRVLNKLIDSYENSAAYAAEHLPHVADAGGNESSYQRGVFCRIDKKGFPEYHDTTSGAYETVHDQLMDLESKGLIRLFWRNGVKGHILEKAALEIGNAEECYKYLGRVPRWEKEERIAAICREYRASSCGGSKEPGDDNIGILGRFLDRVERRLESGDSIKRYADIDDPSGFERTCRLLSAILTNDRELYLRQFSVELFNDSKIAEKELEKAVSVIKEFGNDDAAVNDHSEMNPDEILETFGIYRNPVWIYLKGHASISIGGRSDGTDDPISLQSMNNGIGVTLRDLSLIRPDPSDPPECVMTVENLTSYYQQDPSVSGMKALIIYLGGFAGRHTRGLLKGLRKAYPQARFMHSGDIDCGGFLIWKALCEGTGISFETHNMDADTFRRFIHNGRPLTSHDRKSLAMMKTDPFFEDQRELFELMLETGSKLEQESFVI